MDKIFNDVYADGLCQLCIYYASQERINEFIVTMPSIRSVIVAFYDVMVAKKELVKIEDLEKGEKEKFWKMAPRNLKLDERKDCARAMYLIGELKK